jgi:hypothetical protein
VITDARLVRANLHDLALADDLLADTHGWAQGDRAYWSRPGPSCWPTKACGCRPAVTIGQAVGAAPAPFG